MNPGFENRPLDTNGLAHSSTFIGISSNQLLGCDPVAGDQAPGKRRASHLSASRKAFGQHLHLEAFPRPVLGT